MHSVSKIKQILKKQDIIPLKSLGQHFLIDESVKELFLKLAEINKNDIIVEVGPGLGALTFDIAKKAKQVLAVEKDKKMAKILTSQAPKNVKIIHGDILKIPLDFLPSKYKLISDVPYNIASPILEIFLKKVLAKPKLMVLMLQKELVEKMTAASPNLNNLSIFIQAFCQVKKIADVNPNSFWPTPKVKSNLVLLKPYKKPLLQKKTLAIIKKCFMHKRKKVFHSLKNILNQDEVKLAKIFKKSNIDLNARAENLNINDWLNFEKFLYN